LPDLTTLPALLRRNAVVHGDKPAFVTEDERLSHTELDERSRALAARLVAAGIGKSSRVGLLAPNGVEWAVVACAVMRVGGVLVPLSTLLRPPELEAQLRVADVTHLVAVPALRSRRYLHEVEAIRPALPLLQEVWSTADLPAPAVDDARLDAVEEVVRPADDLAVLFTSGSRGVPKGTIHTHDSALHAVASALEARCLGPDDRMYIPMPFFWAGGFSSGLLATLVAGSTLLTEAVPEPARTLALLERERVTLFRGWPDQAARLAADPAFADADLSALRPGSLAAVLPPEHRPAPGTRPVVFGMSETCGSYIGDRLDRDLPPGKEGSLGRVFEGYEVRVDDGELLVRGRNVMRGICGRVREETFDADGWYRTGDLADIDDDGYVRFKGRADDMFKVKGATVYPSEVEAALRSIPGVRQAHVTDRGALVVTDLALEEVAAAARARLSSFKVPGRWVVTGDASAVPMTATDKVDKAALQALLDGGRPA
jgi:acyl-CoA synthetase (AMP-forming)/AMP-acid ligase II